MSLFQFLRILWARRWVTLATTTFTVLGALLAIIIVPPRYEGVSRVMLNILKPDPITGEVISSGASRTYIATQTELIKDYDVAGKAVDQLNWTSNPDVITRYQTTDNGGMDMRRWLAQRIIDSTTVTVVNGTNILEIGYRASTPSEAKSMADALRNAYIESTLDTRRREATRTADWYETQARQEQALLNSADGAKTAYEKEHGIVMQADNTDVDTARLRALSNQGAAPPPMVAAPMPISSPSSIQLAQLDATIAQAAQNLGPNHPQMVQLRAQRASLAQVAAQEMAASRAAANAAASAASASVGILQREVASQTSRVIQKREQIEKLTQLQSEVNLRRDQYNKSMARIAELRREASVADSGISVLGESVTPKRPSFPNKPLILGGALALGFGLGILLSLLLELLGRRVRSVEDLQNSIDVPLLAVIDEGPSGERHARIPKLPHRRRPPSTGKLAKA
ncbi:Wzz/FepE/Etk N-terminal domain-containing protein [Phenylobacterium sp. Root700]|uniref:Wzz/FepE/Etk N-terminal domain-containing protein n=1 Tax=Phenylobacterium sp. Root700 TaxID=1736591 RepID=UPI0007020399|nr:Wzz/FepE/Etk N-terminal domain-containing protein [Phenylobacterium sp. Root700]KRB42688.1 hypothetical protein ASE02_21180 [Phenylobacterium sp. Root700]